MTYYTNPQQTAPTTGSTRLASVELAYLTGPAAGWTGHILVELFESPLGATIEQLCLAGGRDMIVRFLLNMLHIRTLRTYTQSVAANTFWFTQL